MDSIAFGLFFLLFLQFGEKGGPLFAREDDAIILKNKIIKHKQIQEYK